MRWWELSLDGCGHKERFDTVLAADKKMRITSGTLSLYHQTRRTPSRFAILFGQRNSTKRELCFGVQHPINVGVPVGTRNYHIQVCAPNTSGRISRTPLHKCVLTTYLPPEMCKAEDFNCMCNSCKGMNCLLCGCRGACTLINAIIDAAKVKDNFADPDVARNIRHLADIQDIIKEPSNLGGTAK